MPSPDGSQLLLVSTVGRTWAWTGSSWQRYPCDSNPPSDGVVGVAAATDTTNHVLVAVFSTDHGAVTWTLTGHHWTRHDAAP